MIKTILLTTLVVCSALLRSQSFNDDFESYTAGNMLAATSSTWETWSGPNGGADDIAVSNTNAHSGSQSVYFSSTAASGGPYDIVLPFPGELNTGQFNFDMWMYINPSAGAYFNWQESSTIGTAWSADIYFLSGGVAQFTSGGALLLECSFPEGEWFKLGMHCNLSTNNWEVLINDISQGFYANGSTQIASMDIFPLQGNQFYIDDVSYTYEAYTPTANNGATTAINNMSSGLAGQTVTPQVTIRNLGNQAITSFDVSLTYDGTTLNETISGVNIASLAFYSVDFTQSLALSPTPSYAVATTSNINGIGSDDDSTDDIKTLLLSPIVPASGKMVVGEEGTGTWCPWCVRGTVFMEELSTRYEGFYAGIAVHNADPMAVDAYDSAMGALIGGYPSGFVDRGIEYDPSQFEIPFLERIQITPKTLITNGASYDASAQTLSISASTTFSESVTGDYRIAMVITEDGLSGTTSDWAQSNAYAGGGNGTMGGFESLPNPVPASQMTYNHVARTISPSFNGLPNAFATAMGIGNTSVHNFILNVPSNWNLDNIHIITMVIAPDGTIDNAQSTTLAEATANGFVTGANVLATTEVASPDASLTLYPVPAHEQLMVKVQLKNTTDITVRIISYDGRIIAERTYNQLSNAQVFPIATEALAAGMYSVQVITAESSTARSFIKE